ncbi:glycoside hydrolase [Aspergillus ibericus CBS 121593]|uniref:chitinase n=1 Tax=Aspergillus ibericus CBS 121593 TaxID=1448316 RepID=A0A395GRA4_9EURO|nr:glycoside hydrolase [Aspergillus ibericus CBS 121593]RAK98081.1 glycoside hydrolase [Aspergillus ibericus CBS 121593]
MAQHGSRPRALRLVTSSHRHPRRPKLHQSQFAAAVPRSVRSVAAPRGPTRATGPCTRTLSRSASAKRPCSTTSPCFDDVDDRHGTHRIQACSSYGPDFASFPVSPARITSAESVDVEFELGWWHEGFGLAGAGLRSIVKEDAPSGQATIGLYVGQGLLKQGLSQSALKIFQDNLDKLELCEEGYDSTHVIGVMATSNGTFAPIQSAIKAWANATCLSFSGSTKFAGSATFTTPLLNGNHTTTNSTVRVRNLARNVVTRAEDKCRTVQVEAGNGCADLAVKCGISGADCTKYNPGADFCSTLKPKQHVCCSSGDLPDLRPQPNKDGSCKTHQIQANDNCASLAAEHSLEIADLEKFNKNTWGWNGCELLFKDTVLCLREGSPPFPAEIPNAQCGPQKPGTIPPTNGSKIADLSPCPLNACCNIWGQCGITSDFCIDTNTGAPGTAKPGTYGCISNCGMDGVKGAGSGEIKIAYYEGYCLSRKCLFQDASQIDASQYTHLHFGFGTLTDAWEVKMGDELSTYQFREFKKSLRSQADPLLRWIFRNGVKPANRLTMATKIADFIKQHDLDGVDIDWEYPGAPDLPDFDPGTAEDSPNYLALPGDSQEPFARKYPIADIAKVIDYIVYMTYDLHGQWDAHNSNSQNGCGTGNCLRSQVNLTETQQSLAMITKAGVPGAKVVVGVTSYGRSFKMADPNCSGPNCLYTGDRLTSHAQKGPGMDTAGYLADAEIAEIMKNASRVVKSYVDPTSNSDVLIYDTDEWVAYMSAASKTKRASLYASWGLGGTLDWASDLQRYHDVPKPAKSWAHFIQLAKAGKNPKADHTRNGNWTSFDCTHPVVVDFLDYTPSERWRLMGTDAAWDDVVRIWKDTEEQRDVSFILSSCSTVDCGKGADGATSGPAAQFIWNSLVEIHEMYQRYYDTLFQALTLVSTALKDMENKFAPIPPKEDDTWLLLLVDMITLGALGSAGPFFNTVLKQQTCTTIAKDALPSGGNGTGTLWTPENQDEFSAYLGQVVYGWANVTSLTLTTLFHGTNEALDALLAAMSDGKLIEGKREGEMPATGNAQNDLLTNIRKCIIGFALPAVWRQSGAYTFIIDAGHACNEEDQRLRGYLDADTMNATGVCVDNWQYYRAYPDGAATTCTCKRVTDVGPCKTTCRDNKFSAPKGTAYISGGKNYHGITKIEGDGRTAWTTQVIGHNQREIASHAGCHFGVEATKTAANVNFKVGGQDVIDLINDAIAPFARDGRIGAKGNMNCNGNIKSQPVQWGIY